MTKVGKSCQRCGAPFEVRPYRAVSARFCSNTCRLLALHEGIRGPLNVRWKGGTSLAHGYVRRNNHSGPGLHKPEHVLIVEAVVGRVLPRGAVVHHVNAVRSENKHSNLAVLQTSAEHIELHRKMRVRAAGGDPWRDRMCCSCGPRPASEFYATPSGYSSQCKDCARREALTRSKLVPKEVKSARDAAYRQRRKQREPFFWRAL